MKLHLTAIRDLLLISMTVNKGFFLIFAIFFFSCSSRVAQREETIQDSIPEQESVYDYTESAAMFADSVLNSLTLEEKIGACLMPSFYAESDEYTLKVIRRMIEENHIGGIVLMKGDVASALQIAEMASEAKIPLFVSIDAEWGLAMRLKDAPGFPRNGRIREDADETLMYDYGREVANECREIGINMVLGPVVDISGVYRNIIGNRSFGPDPVRVAELGVAYAKGLESGGVVSVAKHFPGHGSSVVDSHKAVANVYKTISDLDTLDFYPFREYINSGLSGIMAGHIKVPSLTPTGEPATVSYEILSGLLREEMGFKGIVLTDAFNMGGAKGFSAAQALIAGADLVLCPQNIRSAIREIMDRVENGDIEVSLIDDRCRRILFTKALFGLWDQEINRELDLEEFELNAEEIRKALL